MMNTNSPPKDRKNVQYQSPGKLLITSQAAGYILETTAVFDSKDNDTPGNNDLFVVDRIHQSLETTVSAIGQLPHPIIALLSLGALGQGPSLGSDDPK